MKKILFIFGTRPEAVKMAPLIKEVQKHPDKLQAIVCLTGQHREMLDQVNEFFGIKADYDMNLMKPNQSLFGLTARALEGLEPILEECKPDLIIVQGDTTSVFTGALAGFYKKIPVAHLEAGLRSGDKYSPFPEEINRILTGHMADFHLAPTEQSRQNLLAEGISDDKIFVVKNTVIDALYLALDLIESETKNGKQKQNRYEAFFNQIDMTKKIVLITAHRRESFGEPFENICDAIKTLSEKYPEVEFVYPVHLNPNVREVVYRILSKIKNVKLIEPLDYPYLVWLMNKSYFIMTDSGGIQEEAPSLGKPVLVLRDVTERMEGVEAGTAKLVGTDKHVIISEASKLLEADTKTIEKYSEIAKTTNPYGDGKASERIVEILIKTLV
jgi:UDP-N-acetylglucosamine 2-epimerase (non-hydrolysing)